MLGDKYDEVVRLGKAPKRQSDSALVLPKHHGPVFVDEDKDVFIPTPDDIIRRRPLASRIIALLLIPLILLQPFVRVYAQEVDSTSTSDTSQIVSDSSTTDALPVVEVATSTDVLPNATGDTVTSLQGEEAGTTTSETVFSEGVGSTSTETSSTGLSDASSSQGDVSASENGTTSSSSEETVSQLSPDVETNTTSEEATSSSSDATSTESQPKEPAINVDELIREKEESLRVQLRKQVEEEFTKGCVSMDQVGYYCLKSDAPKFSGELSPSNAISEVSAEVDTTGKDKEIFVVQKGERIQLTSNDWEDAFPSRDLSGTSVVWQGQKDGRWQIFYATFASGTSRITQLTQGSENNFNPRVEGNTIVWQSWVDNNWEVYLASPHRGEKRDPTEALPQENIQVGVGGEWDVRRITTSAAHDMFPSIANDIVTWQRAEDGLWGIYAYSISSGITTRISKEGAKSENPRFAVVYDEGGDDGQRRLISYDIASGAHEDLTQTAQQAPYQRPYTPTAPVAANDQAVIPVNTGTSTAKVGNDEGDGSGGSSGGAGGDGASGDIKDATSTDATTTPVVLNEFITTLPS